MAHTAIFQVSAPLSKDAEFVYEFQVVWGNSETANVFARLSRVSGNFVCRPTVKNSA